jgi:hypothetical protein
VKENGWTPERRRRMRERIHEWKPWERSTRPRTPEGKARVARNAYKGGTRPLIRELARHLREYIKEEENIREMILP